jgi:ADP-ribose pyrophosphatase YjhB (NUDIX family)
MSFPQFSPDHCPGCSTELSSKRRDGRERLYCGECEKIIWLNPDIAAGFILKKEDEFLFQKRNISPHRGKWSIPAGYLELDESPLEAAKRELEEETGLIVEGETEFLGHIQLKHPDESFVIVAVFYADYEDVSGDLRPDEEEVQELKFWSFDSLSAEKEKLDYPVYLDLVEKIN